MLVHKQLHKADDIKQAVKRTFFLIFLDSFLIFGRFVFIAAIEIYVSVQLFGLISVLILCVSICLSVHTVM